MCNDDLPEGFSLDKYAEELYSRKHEAIQLEWGDAGDHRWKPQENQCHQNVTILCADSKDYEPVRGWLMYEFPFISKIRFVAHSVIRYTDGKLYDITPPNDVRRPPFIIANDSEEDFEKIVIHNGDFDYNI